jgi:hypothetical protein
MNRDSVFFQYSVALYDAMNEQSELCEAYPDAGLAEGEEPVPGLLGQPVLLSSCTPSTMLRDISQGKAQYGAIMDFLRGTKCVQSTGRRGGGASGKSQFYLLHSPRTLPDEQLRSPAGYSTERRSSKTGLHLKQERNEDALIHINKRLSELERTVAILLQAMKEEYGSGPTTKDPSAA